MEKLLYSRKGWTYSGLSYSIFQWSMSSVSQGFYLRFFFDLGISGFYVYYIVEIIIVHDYKQ